MQDPTTTINAEIVQVPPYQEYCPFTAQAEVPKRAESTKSTKDAHNVVHFFSSETHYVLKQIELNNDRLAELQNELDEVRTEEEALDLAAAGKKLIEDQKLLVNKAKDCITLYAQELSHNVSSTDLKDQQNLRDLMGFLKNKISNPLFQDLPDKFLSEYDCFTRLIRELCTTSVRLFKQNQQHAKLQTNAVDFVRMVKHTYLQYRDYLCLTVLETDLQKYIRIKRNFDAYTALDALYKTEEKLQLKLAAIYEEYQEVLKQLSNLEYIIDQNNKKARELQRHEQELV